MGIGVRRNRVISVNVMMPLDNRTKGDSLGEVDGVLRPASRIACMVVELLRDKIFNVPL